MDKEFGVDQLHDSPGDHQSLFIYWYVWAFYAANFVSQRGWYMIFMIDFYTSDLYVSGIVILVFSGIAVLVILSTTFCVARCKQQWFLIDSARLNPYKIVYRVTKFARQHKVPIQRSAFTYCEDDVPSGLDLGKHKYGGPFTTEQVEDVKAFYGILKILFATGTIFFLQISSNRSLFPYSRNIYELNCTDTETPNINEMESKEFLLDNGSLTSLITVASIPAVIFFIHPFCVNYYRLRMLKRIGIGIILMLMSVICTFSIDSKGIWNCMFKHRCRVYHDSLDSIVQQSLSAFSNILIFPALYEFICAQSPHSMKGLLIGLSFATRGLFELFAVGTVVTWRYMRHRYNNCDIDYYLLNTLVGVTALLAYIYVAKRYNLRERDEPCHVHRYVEEYYSKIQKERHYDYSTSILHQ